MVTQPPWGRSDAVGEALHSLRMTGTFYGPSELTEPWGMELPAMPSCLWFHVVTTGSTLLEAENSTRLLRAGDLALVTKGTGHRLRSSPDAHAVPVEAILGDAITETYSVLRHGGGGARTDLVCGAVRFDAPAARTLVELLPPVLHVQASPLTERLQATLRLMAAEVREPGPGGEVVITRLADILVIQAVRAWLEEDPAARTGWLGALRDPVVGRALAMVHRHPGRDWTVASLAGEAATSRSAFSARFTHLVGEPVMTYVTRWRMQVADDDLRAGDATVAEIARRLGYGSEASFSRAFSRITGVPPGAVRRGTAAGYDAARGDGREWADVLGSG